MTMTTKGLLVRMEARAGKEDEVEEFLRSAEALVREEPQTTAWFAVRFGRSEYGIFDAFPDEEGRRARLSGAVAAALKERADELFARPPEIQQLDVLADKLPDGPTTETVSKGLLLTFEPKREHEEEGTQFLRSAREIVEEEPDDRLVRDPARGRPLRHLRCLPGQSRPLRPSHRTRSAGAREARPVAARQPA
jgi:quinol monooxygenase YgiN